MNQQQICGLTKGFVSGLLSLGASENILPLLAPENVVITEQEITLKNKAPGAQLYVYQGFTAPEVYQNRPATNSSVYFVGALMYSLLTGAAPADARVRQQQNVPLLSGNGPLESLINRAAELDFNRRIASLQQLWQEIGQVEAALSAPASPAAYYGQQQAAPAASAAPASGPAPAFAPAASAASASGPAPESPAFGQAGPVVPAASAPSVAAAPAEIQKEEPLTQAPAFGQAAGSGVEAAAPAAANKTAQPYVPAAAAAPESESPSAVEAQQAGFAAATPASTAPAPVAEVAPAAFASESIAPVAESKKEEPYAPALEVPASNAAPYTPPLPGGPGAPVAAQAPSAAAVPQTVGTPAPAQQSAPSQAPAFVPSAGPNVQFSNSVAPPPYAPGQQASQQQAIQPQPAGYGGFPTQPGYPQYTGAAVQPPKKKGKAGLLVAGIIVVVLLLAVTIYSFVQGGRMDSGIEDGKYDQVVSAADATPWLKLFKKQEYQYAQARLLADEGEYEESIALLQGLGEFKDSQKLIEEVKYRQAVELMESGKLQQSAEILDEIYGYEDSADLLQSLTLYMDAEEMNDPIARYQAYLSLGDFLDSAEKAAAIIQEVYDTGVELYNAENFEGAAAYFAQVAGYENADFYLQVCNLYLEAALTSTHSQMRELYAQLTALSSNSGIDISNVILSDDFLLYYLEGSWYSGDGGGEFELDLYYGYYFSDYDITGTKYFNTKSILNEDDSTVVTFEFISLDEVRMNFWDGSSHIFTRQ
ncbi:MAG: hypothetical protein ACK5L3_13270 [Oscillospiraceae bacterium]